MHECVDEFMWECFRGRSGNKCLYNVLKHYSSLQVPLVELRSDGRDNLLDALVLCGEYIIPEVLTGDGVLSSPLSCHCAHQPVLCVCVCACVCVCVCVCVCRSVYSSIANSFEATVAARRTLQAWMLSAAPTSLPWPSWRLTSMVRD